MFLHPPIETFAHDKFRLIMTRTIAPRDNNVKKVFVELLATPSNYLICCHFVSLVIVVFTDGASPAHRFKRFPCGTTDRRQTKRGATRRAYLWGVGLFVQSLLLRCCHYPDKRYKIRQRRWQWRRDLRSFLASWSYPCSFASSNNNVTLFLGFKCCNIQEQVQSTTKHVNAVLILMRGRTNRQQKIRGWQSLKLLLLTKS